MHFWDQFFRFLSKLVYAGLWIGVACFAYLAVESLAGKETLVDASFSFTRKASSLWWAGLLGLTVMWALGERRSRRQKVRSMGTYITQLETTIDPARSSSELRSDGTANPEDR